MPRVFIVAPTPTLRAGLRALLAQAEPTWEIVGEAPALGRALTPANADLFLLTDPDQLLPLAGVLSDEREQSAVVLTNDDAAVNVLRALPLRGWSITPADASAEELRAAAAAALQGMVALPTDMAGQLATTPAAARQIGPAEATEPKPTLTPREIEVLEQVSRGLPSKLIAHELGVSESTVKFHLSSIYAKLGVASRTEAISRAAKLGLITL
ncbi:MAG: DNA-binding response regulator [Chloroflexi bacterium]|jgi:DNA-binding NarL/FixJ family response regulator|uniref:DNA-binding response regulator n=1 Tax=Candidatus Thermofonsia Clade 3 bacterium TaxID=2364212 RepID=A0A2M8QEN0_9CHLR|nr:response regulator transcription factor [Candidatus Roseilinea sp. NK_OTU-006]PJF48259.1 MAG: DNA-binding response regulator [Candidatus Thermofonsia Clade 3 bacterium]RMG66248.1 MAG: DNA-binding response regulator [Chloroflexota bacterium]